MKSSFPFRSQYWLPLLVLLLALGAVLRLVNLNAPPLDFHSTRQLRNSLVARAVYYDHLPNADPQKRALAESFQRAVGQYEPPITESIVGFTFLLTGGESFAIPRIYGTIYWLLAGLALFDMARRITSPISALISLTFYLVLPFAVQASRSFQPDPLMTSSFVIGLYFLYRWMEEAAPGDPAQPDTHPEKRLKQSWKWAILAAIFLGFAVLVKVVIAFLVGAAAIAAVLISFGLRFWKSRQVWLMAVLMVIPGIGYYVLGHPGRSTEYFFSWTIDLIKLILSLHFYVEWLGFISSLFGLTILFLSLAGTLLAPTRVRWLLISLWIGYLLYGLTLPFQMYTHSYYHIQLIPVVALGLASIVDAVVVRASSLPHAWKAALTVLLLSIVGYQAWIARSVLVAEDFSQQPAVWESISKVIPANAEVIGLTQDYGYDLMYWGWRRVALWPLSTDLSAVKNGGRDPASRFTDLTNGEDYFLVTAFGQLDHQPNLKTVLNGYAIAAQGDGYILYDLRPPEMTLVSIITPSFNQSSFLERTILSVLQQDHPDIEYIVVDGASTDGSLDIINRYAQRLAWWTSEKDHGQSEAINKGFAHAQGEIVAWLNSDDYYLPGAVSAAVDQFEKHPGAVLIYGNMLAVDENDRTINILKYHQLSLTDLLCFQIIGQPAVFMRRSALEKAGVLDITLHCMLDHQLWIRIAEQGEIMHVNETWAAARYHAGAKNRAQPAEFGREAFRVLDWASKEPSLAPILARSRSRARASAQRVNARYLLDGGQPMPALKAWMRALITHPPTALARLNLPASALLEIIGLGHVRILILEQRRERLNKSNVKES